MDADKFFAEAQDRENDHRNLVLGDMRATQRALGFGWDVSEQPTDSLDLGPDDRDDATPTIRQVIDAWVETVQHDPTERLCDVCLELESDTMPCACRCRSCGKPDKSGWCADCDAEEARE